MLLKMLVRMYSVILYIMTLICFSTDSKQKKMEIPVRMQAAQQAPQVEFYFPFQYP